CLCTTAVHPPISTLFPYTTLFRSTDRCTCERRNHIGDMVPYSSYAPCIMGQLAYYCIHYWRVCASERRNYGHDRKQGIECRAIDGHRCNRLCSNRLLDRGRDID